jgi:hypothetical protein
MPVNAISSRFSTTRKSQSPHLLPGEFPRKEMFRKGLLLKMAAVMVCKGKQTRRVCK